MTYQEFIKTISESIPDDWIYDDDLGLYVYKGDIRITILSDRDWGQNHDGTSERFYESWAEKFPDPKAYKKRFKLMFNGTVIEMFYTAAVDGYRCYIPYPHLQDMTLSITKYNIGKILNECCHGYDYNYYIKSAGIKVV